MATIDLGKIKFVNRGAYNNGTAYTPDDVVTSGGSSYICKLASTGNAVTNGTYWDVLAQKGTDGTDVGATLTTQGDILYRDGSGLQRLAKGTAGQALKMNSSANAPEWGTISSDYVRITTSTISSNASDVVIDNIFSATYKSYMIIGTNVKGDTQDTNMRFRFLNSSGSQLTGSNYRGHSGGSESQSTGNISQLSAFYDADIAMLRPAGNVTDNVRGGFNFTMFLPDPFANATPIAYGYYGNIRNNGNSCSGNFMIYYDQNNSNRGVKFDYESGNIASGTIAVYGIKTS